MKKRRFVASKSAASAGIVITLAQRLQDMVDDNTGMVCRRVYVGLCQGSIVAFTLPWSYQRLLPEMNNDNEMMLVWVVAHGVSFCLLPILAM